jgi:septal ring factor EnvC (AmiA/AmiB activator)
LANELAAATTALGQLNAQVDELGELRGDLVAIQASLNSGDSTVLGLAGRLEYVEQSMESVNAYRLQVNDSLYRLQQNVESLQSVLRPAQ